MNLLDYPRPCLAQWTAERGGRPVHAARLWKYIYRDGVYDPCEMRDLPAGLRLRLSDASPIPLPRVATEASSSDLHTRKYLLEFGDGGQVETVLMRFVGRATACLSTQVGCALGCRFCATGQLGFARDLSAGEIVAQALHTRNALRLSHDRAEQPRDARAPVPANGALRNVVLMGMGEPLLNYDAVMDACDILQDSAGLAIGAKQLTLSTVGVVPGIVRLADEGRRCSLAVSLHAATQEQRAAMLPAARAWPLDSLLEACRYYTAKLGRRIFFEWTLIEGRNDSVENARELARLVRGIDSQINLIPLNPTLGYAGAPSERWRVDRFRGALAAEGARVSVRQRRGIDIAAGCGQLAGQPAPLD